MRRYFGGVVLRDRPDFNNARKVDIVAMPMMQRMMRNGIRIDVDYFKELEGELTVLADNKRKEVLDYVPQSFLEGFVGRTLNVDSPEQVAELLFDELGVGAGKELKRTKSGRISTGKKQLEALKGEHGIIKHILDYRELRKLNNTYVAKLPTLARLHPRGKDCYICGRRHYTNEYRVHTELLYTRTDTGRLSCKNPNLMNIPKRSALGRRVRAGFIAGEGRRLVMVDFSQIELRMLAHYCGSRIMVETFKRGGDIHTETAMKVFGKERVEDVDELNERLPCKNVNFMIVYGAMAKGLMQQLSLSGLHWAEGRCEEFIREWFGIYPEAREYLSEQHSRAARWGMVWDLMGAIRLVPELYSVFEGIREAGKRYAGNMPIQGTCAGLLKLAMGEVEMYARGRRRQQWGMEGLLPVHDEIVQESEEDYAEDVLRETVRIMENVVELRVPIRADGKIKERWAA